MEMKINLLFTVFAISVVSSYDSNLLNNLLNNNSITNNTNRYCHIERCPPGVHTMCVYSETEPDESCNRVIRIGLNQNETQRILSVHNNLRSRVFQGLETRGNPGPQPAAIRDVPLEWDAELAIIAQRWANQCNLYCDVCRNLDDYYVGQNLIFKNFDVNMDEELELNNLQELIESWYNEVVEFDRNEVERYSGQMLSYPITTNYTQFVWGDTIKIGCGAIRYHQNRTNPNPRILLVCNYAPCGNELDEPVYEILENRN